MSCGVYCMMLMAFWIGELFAKRIPLDLGAPTPAGHLGPQLACPVSGQQPAAAVEPCCLARHPLLKKPA